MHALSYAFHLNNEKYETLIDIHQFLYVFWQILEYLEFWL